MGFKKLTNDSGTFIVQSSNGTEAWDICNRNVVSRYFPRLYIISVIEIPVSWVYLVAALLILTEKNYKTIPHGTLNSYFIL